jgi:hypothetical protein
MDETKIMQLVAIFTVEKSIKNCATNAIMVKKINTLFINLDMVMTATPHHK